MKKKAYFKKGFTLTEILLAVMIVGLIGGALASLSRGAARESGVGRSRVMLRNNLSLFMRMLRSDLEKTTYLAYAAGPLTNSADKVRVLQIGQGVNAAGNALSVRNKDGNSVRLDATNLGDNNLDGVRWITYCFKRGSTAAEPSELTTYTGGVIWRLVSTDKNASCTDASTPGEQVLTNVKYIPNTSFEIGGVSRKYPVPLFQQEKTGRLKVNLIVELTSEPIVNEVMEEEFPISRGF